MFCDPLREYLGVLLRSVRPDPKFSMIMVVPAFIHLLLKWVSINFMASDDSSHFLSPVCFQILY